MLTADEVIRLLELAPLPGEGGYYRETYRAAERMIPGRALSGTASAAHQAGSGASGATGAAGERALATAIYYLLTPASFSALHRLPGDELYHFYAGDPAELLLLHGDGRHELVRLGPDLAAGQRPQALVPGGTWQGARVAPGGRWSLLGTTMAPGFEFADYTAGAAGELVAAYPACAASIQALTRASGPSPG